MKNLTSKSSLLIFTLSLFTATLFAQEIEESRSINLKIKRLNDSYIDVYYNKPQGEEKLPILVFCQGSGYDSNTEGFLGLLNQFGKKAVGLALEKQGVSYGDNGDSLSDEYKQNNTIYNRLYDYLRVFQYLKTNATWWNSDIYVIGGSEGGLLAGMIASFYPNVKAVAILSFGGGLNFGEAWPISSGLQKKADGFNEKEVEKEIKAVKDSLDYIRANATYLKTYSGNDNTYSWWASIIDLRLENTLLDLNIPIFLGQGSEDIMAPPISAQKLSEDFIKKEKTNLYYKEYEGYDHAFTDRDGQSHLVEVFTEAIEWILSKK